MSGKPLTVFILLTISFLLINSVTSSGSDMQMYTSDKWGFSMEYPESWNVQTILENRGKPDYVIKEKLGFTGPGGPMIVLDIWTNEKGMGLYEWFEAYHTGVFSDAAEIPEAPNFEVAKREAISIYNPQNQACNQQVTYFTTGELIFRLEYRITDGKDSMSVYNHMLKTFEVGK